MSISPKTTEFLNKNGYTASRVNDVIDGEHIPDETIFTFALEHEYHIITSDYDFGEILAVLNSKKPSVIILKLNDRRIENVNTKLYSWLPKIIPDLNKGVIVIIEEHRLRIRELPL